MPVAVIEGEQVLGIGAARGDDLIQGFEEMRLAAVVGAEAMAGAPKDAAPSDRARKTAGRRRPSGGEPAPRASRSRPRR